VEKEVEKEVEKRVVKAPPGEEESPEKRRSPILLEQGEKPLLLWKRAVKVFFQEESLGGAGMQKIGTRSFPPPRSCMSFTLPSEPAARSGKLKEKKFIV
jgi:hypothetical protein